MGSFSCPPGTDCGDYANSSSFDPVALVLLDEITFGHFFVVLLFLEKSPVMAKVGLCGLGKKNSALNEWSNQEKCHILFEREEWVDFYRQGKSFMALDAENAADQVRARARDAGRRMPRASDEVGVKPGLDPGIDALRTKPILAARQGADFGNSILDVGVGGQGVATSGQDATADGAVRGSVAGGPSPRPSPGGRGSSLVPPVVAVVAPVACSEPVCEFGGGPSTRTSHGGTGSSLVPPVVAVVAPAAVASSGFSGTPRLPPPASDGVSAGSG